MAVTFDEASELVGAPPADYGMCGAAGEYSTYTAFGAGGSTGSNDEKFQESSVFSILVSVMAVLFVVVVVALLGWWCSRRKLNGMFYSIDLDPRNEESVVNPIGAVPAGRTGTDADLSAMAATDITDVEAGTSNTASGSGRGGSRGHLSASRREVEMSSFGTLGSVTNKRDQHQHPRDQKDLAMAAHALRDAEAADTADGDGADDDVEISFVDTTKARETAKGGKKHKKEGGRNFISKTFTTLRSNIASLGSS